MDAPVASGTLVGKLLTPAASSPRGFVALLIAGSGPTDGDGNFMPAGTGPGSLKLLAQGLCQAGIASIRYDKRGLGQNSRLATNERDISFEDFVGDAAAWLGYARAGLKYRRVAVIGHSEGALVAFLAARQITVDLLVSIAGAARPLNEVLRMQLTAAANANSAQQAGVDQALAILSKLENGETVDEVPPDLAALFRPSVQPYLISLFRYDPRHFIAGLGVPTLVVQGDSDLQVTPDNATLLHQALPSSKVALLSGMNHVLKHVSGKTLQEQRASYEDGSIPLDPALVPSIAAFICAQDYECEQQNDRSGKRTGMKLDR